MTKSQFLRAGRILVATCVLLNLMLSTTLVNATAGQSGAADERPLPVATLDAPGQAFVSDVQDNSPAAVTSCTDGYEPDDSWETASTISVGGAQSGKALCTLADQDWAKVNVTDGTAYTFALPQVAPGTALALSVYKPNPTMSSPYSIGSFFVPDSTSVTVVSPITGTLWILVNAYAGDSLTGAGATYTLSVTESTICADLSSEDAGNDSEVDARAIAFDTTETHAFCDPGDVDWFEFDVQPGKRYDITAFNLATGVDTTIEASLHPDNSPEAPIYPNDDTPSLGLGSHVSIVPDSGKDRVTFKVEPSTNNTTGNGATYQVVVTESDTACADAAAEANEESLDNLPVLGLGNEASGIFCLTNDVDLFSLGTLRAGNTYRVSTVAAAADVTLIASVNDADFNHVADSLNTPGTLEFTPASTGIYYLMLGDLNNASGLGNSYTVRFSTVGCVDAGIEAEGNDTRATAPVSSLPVSETRGLCAANDEDWYKVELTAGNTYRFQTRNVSGTNLDTYIYLYRGDNVQAFAANDDGGDGGTYASQIEFRADFSGIYYLRVINDFSTFNVDATYDIEITEIAVCVDKAFEDVGDTRATARSASIPYTEDDRGFCISGDEDWYTFELKAGSTYQFQTRNVTGVGIDTYIYLYQGTNGQATLANDDGGDGGTYASQIVYRPDVSGTYSLRVANDFSSANSTSTYDLAFTEIAVCTDAAIEDAGDNTRETARDAALPFTETNRGFCVSGDEDWYKVELTAGNTYRFQTSDVTGLNVDTYLYLFHGESSQAVISNNDGGDGGTYASLIEYRPDVSGVYYLRVDNYFSSANSTSTYTVTVGQVSSCVDEVWEATSDNDRDGATIAGGLPFSETGRGFCLPGDEDWYAVELTAGNTYRFQTLNVTGPNVDTYLYLYQSAGTQAVIANDDGGNGGTYASQIEWRANVSGTHYVRIKNDFSTANSTSTYDVAFSEIAVCADVSAESAGDNIRAGARPVSAHFSETDRGFCLPDDEDWYSLSLVAGNEYTFKTLNVGTGIDTYIYLYQGEQTQAVRANDDGGDGGTHASQIVFTPTTSGTYYLRIVNDFSISSSTSTYGVAISVIESVNATPVTSAATDPVMPTSGWFNRNVSVTLTADDGAGSGIAALTWSAAGAQTIAETTIDGSTATLTISAAGTTTITYWSKDWAQNVETAKTLVVRIDKKRPVTSATVTPDAALNGWHGGDVTVTLDAADTGGSGVRSIVYEASGAQTIARTTKNGTQQVLTITQPGETTISWWAFDRANNKSVVKTLVVKVDGVDPTVSASASPLPTSDDWRKGPVTVLIAGADSGSEVASITYAATGAQTIDETTVDGASATVTLTATGTTTVTYFATDGSGRQSATGTLDITLDNSAPSMDAPFARVSMPSDVDLTTSGTRIKVSWSGDDTGSGIVRYQLHQSTNGGTSWSGVWLPADDTIMIVRRFDPGTYLFRVRGIDAAGNISAWSVSDPLTFSVHDDNDAAMTYTGSWTSDANITTPKGVAVPVYGGSVMTSSTAGDTMTFAVNGSGVSFVTVTGRDRGIVEIIVDGRVAGARTVDLYRTATKGGKILLNIQFARPGDHVVTVRVTGTKHAKSLSPRVDIDGFVVTH